MPTYDHKPEMSARAAAEAFVARWSEGGYRFGIINFANPDMVGHTGVIPAAVAAVEAVDGCLGEVVEAVAALGRRLHRHRRPRQLRPHARARRLAQHRPLAQPGAADRHRARAWPCASSGILADVAPTALELLGIPEPEAMTGRSLIDAD